MHHMRLDDLHTPRSNICNGLSNDLTLLTIMNSMPPTYTEPHVSQCSSLTVGCSLVEKHVWPNQKEATRRMHLLLDMSGALSWPTITKC